MRNIVRNIYLTAALLVFCSCGAMMNRKSPQYHAGNPDLDGYVPEGTVVECSYSCSVPGPSERRMVVYLPKGYSDNQKRYPVLYLLHGARGYETSWIKKGNMVQITDSLFRCGLARPCIVVMPNVNQYNNNKDYDDSRYKSALESVFEIDGTVEKAFITDVVDFVDSRFRTIPEKRGRAIAGLSVGALQSRSLSANFPQAFGYVGMFSPMFKIVHPGPDSDFYRHLKKKQKEQFAAGNEPLGYYYYIGKVDFFRPHVALSTRYMNRKDYEYECTLSRGGHSWENWKNYYIDMLKKLFK